MASSPLPTPRPLATPFTEAQPVAIINGTLIDGTGAPPVDDAYVIVSDGRVDAAGCCASDIDIPDGYRIIDASGQTIMPGLIDGHVHVTQTFVNYDPSTLSASTEEEALLPFLRDGFTMLRDVGTASVVLRAVNFRIQSMTARNLAPAVVWSGPLITAPGGYPLSVPRYSAGGQEVRSIEEAVWWVDEMADAGARAIKLGLDQGYFGDSGWPLLNLDTVRAITDRAHQHGLIVTAHVTSLDEVRLALDGGVDDLAHTPLEVLTDDLMQEMLDRGMTMVSTATIWGANQDVIADNVKRYTDAGGIVSIGTDYGCCNQPAGIEPYLREMEFLRLAGMMPMQLLVGATRNGALVSNVIDESGTIEPGKRGDIIIVDGDPLADLSVLRDVVVVLKYGHVVHDDSEAGRAP